MGPNPHRTGQNLGDRGMNTDSGAREIGQGRRKLPEPLRKDLKQWRWGRPTTTHLGTLCSQGQRGGSLHFKPTFWGG
jgi:hypothetical protein